MFRYIIWLCQVYCNLQAHMNHVISLVSLEHSALDTVYLILIVLSAE